MPKIVQRATSLAKIAKKRPLKCQFIQQGNDQKAHRTQRAPPKESNKEAHPTASVVRASP